LADHIFLSSLSEISYIQNRYKVNRKKITYLPNWIDTDLYKDLNFHRSKNILFVGRLHEEKNIGFLIESLAGTKIDLDIVGVGNQKSYLINLSKKYKVKINFLGVFKNDKMYKIYNKYQYYVICSKHEGNPKTLLEAMSCACTVIGTNSPGISNLIKHKKDGMIVENNEKEMRKMIVNLQKNRLLSLQLAKNARNKIIANNSFNLIKKRESNTLNSLLEI
tara:strand:- start:12 stop:671 length:660 start_codon:yes stop_codon:yes gene_type:complete